MTTLIIDDDLAQTLQSIAEREKRPVEAVLRTMIEHYEPSPTDKQNDALEAMLGMFDDDVTDLSTTVHATMQRYYQEKYGDPD